MARKIKSPAPAKGADDLAVLHPERELEIGGETITVREYGFLEGLKIQRSSVVLVKALVEAQKEGDAPYNTIQSVLSDHADTLVELMAAAADVDPDWIRGLSDADGQLLMGTWWMVNGPFFVRRVALELAAENAPDGATSTPPSPPTDTEAQRSSDATPSGS